MRLLMIQQTEVDTEMGKSEPIVDSPLQALKWINPGVPKTIVPGLLSSALVISLLSLPSLSPSKDPTQFGDPEIGQCERDERFNT